MTAVAPVGDLMVLVADKNMEATIRGLLARHQSFDVPPIRFQCFVHPERDPGCLRKAADFLSMHSRRYRFALVVFDRVGCGREHKSRVDLEQDVEGMLAKKGWEERCAVISIDPELENWVWAESVEVENALGWSNRDPKLKEWLISKFELQEGTTKPRDPKKAMETALRIAQKPRSSSIYAELASRVGINRCTDPSFTKLRTVIKGWFSAT